MVDHIGSIEIRIEAGRWSPSCFSFLNKLFYFAKIIFLVCEKAKTPFKPCTESL